MVSNKYDIIIIGGGINGLCAASLLSKLDLSIAVIDSNNIGDKINTRVDGRGIALAKGSEDILEKFALWEEISTKAGLIKKIIVKDCNSPQHVDFDTKIVEESHMGMIIEMDDLCRIFYDNICTKKNITIIDKQIIKEIKFLGLEALVNTGKRNYRAKLIIAADGKNSFIKNLFSIKSYQCDYKQLASVFNINHTRPHNNTAYECFYPNGPLAILPLKSPNISSIVWTEKLEMKELFEDGNHTLLENILQERFYDFHGEINIISKINYYPLSLKLSKAYYHKQIVFIGDSLHYLHPIAGQGFNLSLRDIYSLYELIEKYINYGLGYNSLLLLEEFYRVRSKDNYSMAFITDGLNRLFSNNNQLIKSVRNTGLEIVNNIPAMQRFFVNYAMGKRREYDTNS